MKIGQVIQYPNCDNLVIHVAESMNVHNKLNKGEHYEKYHKKDKEKSIENLEKVIRKIKEFKDNDKSELYEFRKYKNSPFDSKKYMNLFKTMINKNSDYEFIRDDIRVKRMFDNIGIN